MYVFFLGGRGRGGDKGIYFVFDIKPLAPVRHSSLTGTFETFTNFGELQVARDLIILKSRNDYNIFIWARCHHATYIRW